MEESTIKIEDCEVRIFSDGLTTLVDEVVIVKGVKTKMFNQFVKVIYTLENKETIKVINIDSFDISEQEKKIMAKLKPIKTKIKVNYSDFDLKILHALKYNPRNKKE